MFAVGYFNENPASDKGKFVDVSINFDQPVHFVFSKLLFTSSNAFVRVQKKYTICLIFGEMQTKSKRMCLMSPNTRQLIGLEVKIARTFCFSDFI